ncbi:MAG TPA: hypothetical protein VJJ51_04820 [Candidatus Methanoperedens sp.]|nr:hypothetical protein [Candidatus Methanoperedens sp.]HLB70349.1 hypothetical protein [Candidatus Methanoperedens sp.]
MQFVKVCPKCKGKVQTKNLRKSIGLGTVDIPVAQFCINPTCNWYQDFTESKKAEDIREDTVQIKIPKIKNRITEMKKHLPLKMQEMLSQKETQRTLIRLGFIILLCIILIFQLPVIMHPPPAIKATPSEPVADLTEEPLIPAETPAETPLAHEPKMYPVKVDVMHGFNPGVIVIDRYDTVAWNNWESQRTRILLVSRDGLFENRLMRYNDRFSYQFNQSGNFTFVLAEYGSSSEYPDAAGSVVVR